MLLDEIVNYSDAQYRLYGENCGNRKCTRPAGHCSGSCYNCLYYIHYPDRAPVGSKKLYDCPKMLFHYVCQYSYLYTRELLCAFEEEYDFLKEYSQFNILSLGCGGCADLMALEYFLTYYVEVPVHYIGIDINKFWIPIHQQVERYCNFAGIDFHEPIYEDAFKFVQEYPIEDTNVIIISYLISYLYNSNQIDQINSFIDNITENIIKRKGDNKLLLVINDVNSNRRGRNYFADFEECIRGRGLTVLNNKYKYFDTGHLNVYQMLGTPYEMEGLGVNIPETIQRKYHARTEMQTTIQLLLEVV